MSDTIITPPHQVTTTSTGKSITIHPWAITTTDRAISNAPEISAIQEELNGLPLPEMPFGNNSLVIRNEDTGWEYTLNTVEALRLVKLGPLEAGDGGVQVGYAKEWLKSRYVTSKQALDYQEKKTMRL